MKKIIISFLGIAALLLVSCKKVDYEEYVPRVLEKIEIPDFIDQDLELEYRINVDGYQFEIEYLFSDCIDNSGQVTFPQQQTEVTVYVKIIIEDFFKIVNFKTITVDKALTEYEKMLSDAINSLNIPNAITKNYTLTTKKTYLDYEVNFEYTNDFITDNVIIYTRRVNDFSFQLKIKASYNQFTYEKEVTVIMRAYDYYKLATKAVNTLDLKGEVDSDIEFVDSVTVDGLEVKFIYTTSNEAISNEGVISPVIFDVTCIIYIRAEIEDYSEIVYEKEVVVKKTLNLDFDKVEDATLLLIDLNSMYIELTKVTKNYPSPSFSIYFEYPSSIELATIDDLMIGLDELVVYYSDEFIEAIVIKSDFKFSDIRVAIRNSINDIADDYTLYHDSIDFTISKQTTVNDYMFEKSYILYPGTVNITLSSSSIIVNNNGTSYTFNTRIIINRTTSPIKINSISRGGDKLYYGDMDISCVNFRLLLINQVEMEEYLRKVVPSEMPTSWNKEALKAQAVAARTYAYMEIYNKKYLDRGYVVDDSTSSQVYNNQSAVESTDTAISETKGLVMFHGDKPIIAYYYSASCGLTSNGNEVWITDKVIEPIEYLIGKNLASKDGTPLAVNTSSEADMLSFFKMISFTNPGGNSTYHRWKISFTKAQLTEMVKANIYSMSQSHPDSYFVLEDGNWVTKEIPADIGNVIDVYVLERGTSGVVVSLAIVTDRTAFKIVNQYNIRFTLRAKDAKSTVTLYTATQSATSYKSSGNNPSILNSGFFALEWNQDVLTIYGGGNGHGVGMDQYGANYYASIGYSFKDILRTYYTDITFKES